MQCMENDVMPAERLVIVSATQLDDLLELARLAAAELPLYHPLRSHLSGSIAAIRVSSTMEP